MAPILQMRLPSDTYCPFEKTKINLRNSRSTVMQRVGVILWRVLKIAPIVGYIFVIAAAPNVLRRKGYVLGTLAVVLDLIPLICLVKAAVEVFTGDLIPDKFEAPAPPRFELAA